ncbi:hypothetical protein Sjap_012822 [Stephania japonica]|uniref:Uncharacterized protein n=1 Tax=Stephania japonica TaxID=461633 RepID=A0AAP0NZB4_9MAGN
MNMNFGSFQIPVFIVVFQAYSLLLRASKTTIGDASSKYHAAKGTTAEFASSSEVTASGNAGDYSIVLAPEPSALVSIRVSGETVNVGQCAVAVGCVGRASSA